MTVRRRVVVHGFVQGVGFRYATRRQAETCGIHGWVRNREDGAVEAVFEGPADAVESMVRWCEAGPRSASVERVEVVEEEPEGLHAFRITG